jgi:hypothetical protein
MGIITRALWYIVGGLVLALVLSLAGALYFRGEAKTLTAEKNAVQADLTALKTSYNTLVLSQKARVKVDTKQSAVRATKAQAVRAVRSAIKKETENENDSHFTASPAQLERLRRLADAANTGIRSASKLP